MEETVDAMRRAYNTAREKLNRQLSSDFLSDKEAEQEKKPD